MTDIKSLINRPEIQEYAATARRNNRSPIAEFLAPTVPVPANFQMYKEWTRAEQPPAYKSRRAVGHNPDPIPLFPADETRQSVPHGLSAVVDRMFLNGNDHQSLFMLKQAIETITIESEKAREVEAVSEALRLAGAGEDIEWGANVDPVTQLDQRIMTLMKQARCPHVSVLFGATAFHTFKHHPLVKPRCTGGLTHAQCPGLLHNNAPFLALYAVENDPEATGEQFVMSNSILVFARTPHPNHNSRDWMKSFELDPELQQVQLLKYENPHDILVFLAWEGCIKRSNDAGVLRLNLPA